VGGHGWAAEVRILNDHILGGSERGVLYMRAGVGRQATGSTLMAHVSTMPEEACIPHSQVCRGCRGWSAVEGIGTRLDRLGLGSARLLHHPTLLLSGKNKRRKECSGRKVILLNQRTSIFRVPTWGLSSLH
jgi:hypothetical protein